MKVINNNSSKKQTKTQLELITTDEKSARVSTTYLTELANHLNYLLITIADITFLKNTENISLVRPTDPQYTPKLTFSASN